MKLKLFVILAVAFCAVLLDAWAFLWVGITGTRGWRKPLKQLRRSWAKVWRACGLLVRAFRRRKRRGRAPCG